MKNTFEVKEFDSIISNPDYKDLGNYKYLEKDKFENLITFIHEFATSKNNEDVLKFMRISYKRNIGEIISIRNYVGLIQLKDGFQIQILPKIFFLRNINDNNNVTKKIFIKMLKSLKNFPSKIFNESSLKIENMNLYEIFINMYIQEVNCLVKKGLKSAYINKQNNLNFYKGKLLSTKNLRENIVHKERFYVSYEEFQINRSENKLIKSTLLKLQKITNSFSNSKEIKLLLSYFEKVTPSKNFDKDFSKVIIDRNTKDYKTLMQWSNVFLKNKSFSTFSGCTKSRALLFPMETIYESYVAKELKKYFLPSGWNISTQDKGKYLFNEPQNRFAIKPDIVIKKENRIIILDTKWKNLIGNENKNYGISQSDMYQMYAYSKKYNTAEIWLLYPINSEMQNHTPIKYCSKDQTTVNIHFIDLLNIEENLIQLRNKIEKP